MLIEQVAPAITQERDSQFYLAFRDTDPIKRIGTVPTNTAQAINHNLVLSLLAGNICNKLCLVYYSDKITPLL